MVSNEINELEIGFGDGKILHELCKKYPKTNYFGIEIQESLAEQLYESVSESGINNLKIFNNDAKKVIKEFPDSYFDGIHIYFPTPEGSNLYKWEKLLTMEFIEQILRIMKSGAICRIVTDDVHYYNEVYKILERKKIWMVDWVPLLIKLPDGYYVYSTCEKKYSKLSPINYLCFYNI